MNSIIEAQETLRSETFKFLYDEVYKNLEKQLRKDYLMNKESTSTFKLKRPIGIPVKSVEMITNKRLFKLDVKISC